MLENTPSEDPGCARTGVLGAWDVGGVGKPLYVALHELPFHEVPVNWVKLSFLVEHPAATPVALVVFETDVLVPEL